MEQTLGVLIGVALTLVAARFALQLRRSQRRLEAPSPDETPAAAAEREAEMRQVRRRWQTAVMLAILGLLLAVGVWIPAQQFPTLYVLFGVVAALLTCWIAALAIGDLLLVNHRRVRLAGKMASEQAALDRELRNARLKSGMRGISRGEHGNPNDLDLRAPPDAPGAADEQKPSPGDRPDASLN